MPPEFAAYYAEKLVYLCSTWVAEEARCEEVFGGLVLLCLPEGVGLLWVCCCCS